MLLPVGATDVSTSEIRAMTPLGVPIPDLLAASFDLWYRRDGAIVPISLSNLTAVTSAHSDGGIISISDGWYRLDMPDAAFITGVYSVLIGGSVTGGVVISAPITLIERTIGSGKIYINHDYPTEDFLLVTDPDDSPQGGVTIRWYLKSDWDAGNRGADYARGETYTNEDGRWNTGLFVFAGDIVLTFTKKGYYFKSQELTVS